ncbi:MAG TPA: hypothetical protein VMI75_16665 [Polyangiaceae bacterium]|nr:hypothetical protein [Polyangiaceae bacterium]
MRRRTALLLGCTLLACGGHVGSEPSADGGEHADASIDVASIDVTSPMDAREDAALESSAPFDTGADAGVSCGYIEGGLKPCVPCPGAMPSGTCDYNGVSCTYGGGDCTCTSGCTEGQCCPASCAQLGFPCGISGDGCGGILHCRECPAGQTCGTNGVCDSPDDAGCVPTDCGHACGLIDDGCGGKIDCGECFWSCVLSGP